MRLGDLIGHLKPEEITELYTKIIDSYQLKDKEAELQNSDCEQKNDRKTDSQNRDYDLLKD